MSALVATRRKPKFGNYCEMCKARKATIRKSSNFDLTVLGWPLMKVCRTCRPEAERIWEEAS